MTTFRGPDGTIPGWLAAGIFSAILVLPVCRPGGAAMAGQAAIQRPSAAADGAAGRNREVIAAVNRENIYRDRYLRKLADAFPFGPESGPTFRAMFPRVKEALLEDMIDDVLLGQEAGRRGYETRPDVAAAGETFRRKEAGRRLLALLRRQAELDAGKNEDEFRKEIPPRQPDYRFYAMALSDPAAFATVERELRAGRDFLELARLHATGFAKNTGGDLGWVTRDEKADVIQNPKAYDLKPGEMTAPVETPLGYVVYYLKEKRLPTEKEYADAVKARLAQRKKQEADKKLTEEIRGIGVRFRPALNAKHFKPFDPPLNVTVEYLDLPPDAVARIGEKVLPVEEYGGMIPDPAKEDVHTLGYRRIEKELIEEILSAEALGRGLGSDPRVEEATRIFIREMATQRMMQELVYGRVTIRESDLRDYHKVNREKFRVPAEYRVGFITVSDANKADELRAQASPSNFEELARKHSEDYASRGITTMDWTPATRFPPSVGHALSKADVGSVTEVVRVGQQHVILLVLERKPPREGAFEDVRNRVEKQVREREEKHGRRRIIDRLRYEASIMKKREMVNAVDWRDAAKSKEAEY